MALPMAAWRLSYTSGKWLALSGPTSLVVMTAPPAQLSGLVSELWEGMLQQRSTDEFLAYLSKVGIGVMPSFAAFFWDAKGLHGICRGEVKVVGQDGEVALDASGYFLWNEENLDAEGTFTVTLEPVGEDDPLLPLVVGTALVSSITLTTAKDQLLRFPSADQLGVLPKIPMLGLRPRVHSAARGGGPEPTHAVPSGPVSDTKLDTPQRGRRAAMEDNEPVDESDVALSGGPVTASVAESSDDERNHDPAKSGADADETLLEEGQAVASAADEVAVAESEVEQIISAPNPGFEDIVRSRQSSGQSQEDLEADTSMMPVFDPAPETDQLGRAGQPGPVLEPLPQLMNESLAQQQGNRASAQQSVPIHQPSAPVVVPGNFGEVDDSQHTVFSTNIAATHKPVTADAQPEPQLMAAPCARGHANPVGARSCRICSAPVDSSKAKLIRVPIIAGVCTNAGDFVNLVGSVVIGRSPDAQKSDRPGLTLAVPSPQKDISRSHIIVEQREWNIVARDLNSTNGTTIRPVGEAPFELRDGKEVQVEIGAILDLGEGVSLRIEPPRNV